ncbi:MAG: O-antigen ligase family protein, partial [Bacteroidales bacterium]|nr:O-antigen ligase family protein [Bacteroidales bacterium]
LFKIKVKLNYFIKGATLLIIMIFFLFLNSTSGLFLISFVYLYIVLDLYFFSKKKTLILFPLILITTFYTLTYNFDSFNSRYKYYANNELKTEKQNGSVRKFIDLNAHKILIQSSLFGAGTGDVKPTLEQFYIDNGVDFGKYFNAHNQFIQTNIALGFIGLSLLLLIFFLPMIKMIREKEFFLFTIFLLMGISFLFESMLDRNMGSYFFSLIYILSIIYIDNQTDKHLANLR